MIFSKMLHRIFWLWLASLLPLVATAQNLVPNGSFELYTACPTTLAQINYAVGWDKPIGHTGTSDYLHTCGVPGLASVPLNIAGTQQAYQGDAYVGLMICSSTTNGTNYREYITTQLTSPLVAGQVYEVSAYYSHAENFDFTTDKLQFYFSSTPASWVGNYLPMSSYVPQASIPTGFFLTDQLGWTKLSAQFTAAGGEEYITIGNFLDDSLTPAHLIAMGGIQAGYIYLDGVSLNAIVPVAGPDSSICLGSCHEIYAHGDSIYAWTTTINPVPFSTDDTLTVCPTVTTSYIVTGTSFVDTVTITVLQAPVPALGADTTICDGDQMTLDAGNPGMSYLWTPGGAVTQSITVGASGSYQVVVSNACGVGADERIVSVEALPTPFVGHDTTICPGASLPLDAGPGYAGYSWSTGATTQAITAATAGNYLVTVTSALGCEGFDTITVSYSLPIGLLLSHADASCFGVGDGTATAIPSGSAPFTLVWNAPGNPVSATITNLAAGTYTITVTDVFGCSDIGSVIVSQPPAIMATVQWNAEACAGDNDGTATVTAATGFAPHTFLWSNGDPFAIADSLGAGTYTVTITDAHGCVGTATTVVGAGVTVVATAGNNASFCEGSGGDTLHVSASGGNGPYYYQWWCHGTIGPCGLDSVYDDDPLANPSVSGWYYVQATDGGGCQSLVDSMWVEVLPRPIVNAGPDRTICGDSAPCQLLTPTATAASGPFVYQWSPSLGLNNASIAYPCARPDTTTIYALVVTAANGCSSEVTTTDTLATITVHVQPIPIADAGPDQHLCLGDTATLPGLGLGAGPAYSFNWSPSNGIVHPAQGITNASPSMTTTFTLVTWSNGCPSYGDDVTVHVHTIPTINAGADREICLGDTVLLDAQASGDSTASYGFVWWPSVAIAGMNLEDASVWPSSTTTYFVEAASNYGCGSSIDSVLVSLLPSPIANAGLDATICLGDAFQFQGSYAYTTTAAANPNDVFQYWTPGAGMNDALLLMPTAAPSLSGLYTLTVYTGVCSSQDSMLLAVVPALGLSAGADTTVLCEGDSIWLQASAALVGANFTWSPQQIFHDPLRASTMAAPTDTMGLQVVASVGDCADTAWVLVQVIPNPQPGYLQSLPSGCAPLAVSFLEIGDHALAYTWHFGDGSAVSNAASPTHIYTLPGSYLATLTALNVGGCAASYQGQSIVVSEPLRPAFHSDPSFPCELSLPSAEVHFYNDVPGALGYAWDFGDGVRSNEANPTHIYHTSGTYFVTLSVTNADDCSSWVTHGTYNVLSPDLFIPNVFSPNGDGINDVYMVNYSGSQPFTLQIADRWGVKVYAGNNKTIGWSGKDTQGEDVSDGVYYYSVKIGDKEYTGPVTLVR
jgi:gliding motility-associated-like protein